jgi:protoporphyrinogen/coproporphyrinogen III oxidase
LQFVVDVVVRKQLQGNDLIAIVGAGITGLVLAHRLAARGVPHVVLEASGRPGGVIRTRRVEGHVLDYGPQRVRLTGAMAELVRELGLEDEVVTAPPDLPLFVYARGKLRLAPFSAPDFLRTDLLSISGTLRLLLEPLTGGPRPGESVAAFFTRKLGRQAYERLAGPLYGGLYASDPADMVVDLSLAHVLREFGIGRSLLLPLLRRGGRVVPPPAASFREGMQTLPDALWRAHRDTVRLDAPVRALSRCGDGWTLQLDGETVAAERVVLTTPAWTAAELLRGVAPEAAERIGRLHYNPLAVVHLHAETPLRGLGFQVSLAETLHARGVTFNDSLFGRTGVYTMYLGGAKSPEVVARPDAEIAEVAAREFRQTTGYEARVLGVARERMPAWDRSWAALAGLTLPAGLHLAASWESRPGLPGRLVQARRLADTLAGTAAGERAAA